MKITETIYVPTREAWREWLSAHHADRSEIWLVSFRKHTGRPTVPYHEAVEEALCFGWIDSTRKGMDEDSYAQRFTPRRAGVEYSQTNKERLARLAEQGKLTPAVEAELAAARPEAYEIPDDIRAALQARSGAWEFFLTTPPAYQRIRAAYVDGARKRPGEFEKRLNNLVAKCEKREKFGYGIEDFY